MTCFFKGLQTYPYLVLTVNLRDFLDVYDFMCTVPCKFRVSFILLECRSHGMHVQFWLTKKYDNYIFYITLYELSPGIQVSSSRCTFLVKFYITLDEPVWTEPWNPGLKFVKIQSKSVHGVCSLHLHVKTNILMIENMLTTCIVTQSPSKRSQQCPTTHVQLTFWQTGHTRG